MVGSPQLPLEGVGGLANKMKFHRAGQTCLHPFVPGIAASHGFLAKALFAGSIGGCFVLKNKSLYDPELLCTKF